MLDSEYRRVRYLHIGSNLPKYRGQGINQALDWARVQRLAVSWQWLPRQREMQADKTRRGLGLSCLLLTGGI